MKRRILLALAVCMLLSLFGCAGMVKTYEDGSYFGKGDERDGGYEAATVTVENGVIMEIVLKRFKTDDTESDYEYWTGEKAPDGITRPNLKQYRLDIAAAMPQKQSPDVDAVSGATLSSKGWTQAVERALKSAEQK